MDNQSPIRRFLSIRLRFHPTWFLVIILITGVLITGYPENYPLWERISLGLGGSLLFLASMACVQLLANIATMVIHLPVRNTTLFIFGGVVQLPEDVTSTRNEIIAAIVTIILNLLMAVVFNWFYLHIASTSNSPIVLIIQWLALFWYFIAFFHIIPAFPLSGGKILAALIWRIKTGK